jgi:hypothetical protein
MFYRAIFGMVAVYEAEGFIQAQTPGARDVIVFAQTRQRRAGWSDHPFRLVSRKNPTSIARSPP